MAKYFAALSKLCLTQYYGFAKTAKKPEKDRETNQKTADILNLPPKKPLTAYILYFQDRVPYFQEKYPSNYFFMQNIQYQN